jgi:hypothetical protein
MNFLLLGVFIFTVVVVTLCGALRLWYVSQDDRSRLPNSNGVFLG